MSDNVFRGGRGSAIRKLLQQQTGQETPPSEPDEPRVVVQDVERTVPMGRSRALARLLPRPTSIGASGDQPSTSAMANLSIQEPITLASSSPVPATSSPIPAITRPTPAITDPTPAITDPTPAITGPTPAITGPTPATSSPTLVTPIEARTVPTYGRGRAKILSTFLGTEQPIPEMSLPKPDPVVKPVVEHESKPKALISKKLTTDEVLEPVVMLGTSGSKINVTCNYIRLQIEPGKGVFQYDVEFEPEVDSKSFRYQLLKTMTDKIGDTRSFDGRILYLPYELPDKVTIGAGELPSDKSPVTIRITLTKKLDTGHREVIHLYNVVFRKIMHMLGYILHGENYFDPKANVSVPAHKLEIWPGYITSIQDYEGGIMICCDASHRVLRTQTVFQYMQDIEHLNKGKNIDWKEIFTKNLVGQSVLTRYNNKTYRIDDVDFSRNPTNTFEYKGGSQMSYIQYYEKQYSVQIKDRTQPLLQSEVKYKIKGETERNTVDLIPELCFLSGLTDEMRSDMRIMKDVANHTRISPTQRQFLLREYIKNIQRHADAKNLLKSWGLSVADNSVMIEGRVVNPEDIYFANNAVHKGNSSAEWSRMATQSNVLSAIDMFHWIVICTKRDESKILDFASMVGKCAPQLGIKIAKPEVIRIDNDNTNNYISAIKTALNNKLIQMVVTVLPSARADKYSAIKKLCCIDLPIPSQVILTRTLSRPDKLRSIVQKIILQMNCKLGGTLWSVKIPIKSTMVIGLDTYHDAKSSKRSVGAVVASMNPSLTRWYSRVYLQQAGAELISGLEICVLNCLLQFKTVNGIFPDQIILYRDGVGDGQVSYARDHELPQMITAIHRISQDYKPMILGVIVQKRISTRIFAREGTQYSNPPPGTIVDHTVCRRNFYDFFLVAQNVRQGTVSPTHYIVIYNSTKMNPDQIQRLTFKLTHLYYNWAGTVRVPAPCQYAHKLASLIGESVGRESAESLNDKLYYL